jgi:proprotein convertase subtilisin/kexin type 5
VRQNARHVDIQKIANCLKQSDTVCLQCAYGYYLNGGQCFPVPDGCLDFNYSNNFCTSCYQGYYLDGSNVCQVADFLCQSSDKRGNCLTCYKDYRLTAYGRCVYNAEGCDFNLPAQEQNPLCAKFSGLQCTACVQGCYLNPQGKCKLPDPNCQSFDIKNEKCNICMEGYCLGKDGKKCVRVQGY